MRHVSRLPGWRPRTVRATQYSVACSNQRKLDTARQVLRGTRMPCNRFMADTPGGQFRPALSMTCAWRVLRWRCCRTAPRAFQPNTTPVQTSGSCTAQRSARSRPASSWTYCFGVQVGTRRLCLPCRGRTTVCCCACAQLVEVHDASVSQPHNCLRRRCALKPVVQQSGGIALSNGVLPAEQDTDPCLKWSSTC